MEPGISCLRGVSHPPFSTLPFSVRLPHSPASLHSLHKGFDLSWPPGPCWPPAGSRPGLPCSSLGRDCQELPFCNPPASEPTLPPSSALVGPAPAALLWSLEGAFLADLLGPQPQHSPRLLSRSQRLHPDSLGSLLGLPSPPTLAPRLCTAVPIALVQLAAQKPPFLISGHLARGRGEGISVPV